MEAEKAMISAKFFDGGREGAALRKNDAMKNQCPAQGRGMPWRCIGASRFHFSIQSFVKGACLSRDWRQSRRRFPPARLLSLSLLEAHVRSLPSDDKQADIGIGICNPLHTGVGGHKNEIALLGLGAHPQIIFIDT
jgi:hypothetical protein